MDDISIEQILNEENIAEAISRVKKGKDTAGRDGFLPSQLDIYWENNKEKIIESINKENYEPGIVEQREIVSYKGKRRTISIMNACDRMLARAAAQVLSPAIDSMLSDRCFDYRTGLGTKSVADFAVQQLNEKRTIVVEEDIKDFFDNIDHNKLIERLEKFISDEKIMQFLMSYISCKIDKEGTVYQITEGVLQGSPLSPLFSNIFLNDFDRECENRFPGYCRYADDIRIYTSTRDEAEEAKAFIEYGLNKEKFRINKRKCGIYSAVDRPLLGYEIYFKSGLYQNRQIPKSHTVKINNSWEKVDIQKPETFYHLLTDGIISKKDYNLLFENEDGKRFLPAESINAINIYSNVVFDANFFDYMNREKIIVNIVDRYGHSVGKFVPKCLKCSYKAEMAQIQLINNEKQHLKLAKIYQNANVFNIRAALRYYERRLDAEIIHKTTLEISEIIKKLKTAKSLNELMIGEAQARQKYYNCFNAIMSADDFEFTKRTRRPPKDAINAMISFGNTLLYNKFSDIIYRSQLDIRFGILHSSFKRPENLNLDLADLFKPILVDRTIFTLVNRKMIDEDYDFESKDKKGVYMTYHGRSTFIMEFDKKLNQMVSLDGTKKSYAQIMQMEVENLQEYFLNEKEYKPYRYIN